jgi:hypothetical protein
VTISNRCRSRRSKLSRQRRTACNEKRNGMGSQDFGF